MPQQNKTSINVGFLTWFCSVLEQQTVSEHNSASRTRAQKHEDLEILISLQINRCSLYDVLSVLSSI